jgi:F-type H+-transporting ATPase subunit epsilon
MVSLNREGGLLSLTLEGDEQTKKHFLVMGGASSVLEDKVTVLGRYGIALEDIDVEAVRAEAEECRKAIDELQQKNDPQDQATLVTNEKRLAWCEAQLKYGSGTAA